MSEKYLREITVNGETREVKMTYGLLDQLCRISGDVDAALLLAIDHDLRHAALSAIFAERDKTGKITKEFNAFEFDADPEDVTGLLDWAGAHVLDFFLKAATRAQKTGSDRRAQMEALTPT